MTFAELAKYLEELEKTSSRNEITTILAEVFKKAKDREIDKIVYLLSGQLAPKYKGIVFNLAERMMFQILARAYGKEASEIRALYKEKGDLGNVAESLAKTKRDGLTVEKVYEKLLGIAEEEGAGSQERKITKMAELLAQVDPLGARFIARIPVGKLRLGFSDMTILDALSLMIVGDKSARPEIERAFNVTADIGQIAKKLKEKGLEGIKSIEAEPGTPIRPSLAERLPSADKILEKMGKSVAVEPKYDGFRSQLHVFTKDGKRKVMIFSRNLDNTTHMFPELVAAAQKLEVGSAIFDGEAIAYDPKNDKFLPFQETVQRKRKYGIKEAAEKYPLILFVFDILYKDGKTLLNLPFNKRRAILENTLKGFSDKTITATKQNIVSSAEGIRRLVGRYLSEGLEGAMIKKLDAPYKAGGRGFHWVKYKKSTEKGLMDTIDCVVMGLYRGRGKRAAFGVGAFLAGIRENGKFKTVSKIGTGLSDEQWKELFTRTKKLVTKNKPKLYEVDKSLIPDFWVTPSLVVEIMADEITKSPVHTAGMRRGRGYALRFPRLVRFRDDKDAKQATTISELKELYKMQKP